MSEQLPRPPQATVAVLGTAVGALLTVLFAWDAIANLHSLDAQNAIAKSLGSNPPGGITVATMTTIMHGANLVEGACAAAAIVLAAYAWRRQKAARLALSVIAPVLVLTGVVSGNLVTAVIAAAVMSLWLQPNRAWFDGKPVPKPVVPPLPRPVAPPQDTRPDPTWAAPDGHPHQPPTWAPVPSPAVAGARPAPVLWAAVVTLATSAMTALVLAVVLMVVLAEPDSLLREVHRLQPDSAISDQALLASTKWAVAVLLVWAVVGVALGLLVLRRGALARRALMASSVATLVVSLLALAVGGFLAVLNAAAAVAVLALLLRSDSAAWFRR